MYVYHAKVVHYNTQEEGCVAAPCSVRSYLHMHVIIQFSVESLLLCMDNNCVNTVSAFIYGPS